MNYNMSVIILAMITLLLPFSAQIKQEERVEFIKSSDKTLEMVFEVEIYEPQNKASNSVIIDYMIDFALNKAKAHITSVGQKAQAIEVIWDYSSGEIFYYFNQTGECICSQIPKVDSFYAFQDFIINNTTFIGNRGRNLELWQLDVPNKPEEGIWLYAKRDKEMKYNFVSFQHYSNHVSKISGKFMDELKYSSISSSDLQISLCLSSLDIAVDVLPSQYLDIVEVLNLGMLNGSKS
ncbi:unnamed protein product [Moneuplotes crassus]|uniref:Uncharacterized protein n=1 Tax=Euplotes crassus TaxID=5936 RepID=A0AAD1XV74_EUPCR|nr:unnamed protein product [Moneuplotes crassus]